MIIYHISEPTIWEHGIKDGKFFAPSLETVGFIHCCLEEQIDFVLEHWFPVQAKLMLVGVDTDKLEFELVFEKSEGGETLFPHVYGPLNLSAVTSRKILNEEKS